MSRTRASRDSLSLRGSEWSNDNGSLLSQKSQGLRITSPRKTAPRADRRSLSLIVNKSIRKREASQHGNASMKNIGVLTEDMTWNIIDREIFEWQYVCRTGRPYWWSRESKFGRYKKLQPRLFHSPNTPLGTKELSHEGPKPDYSVVRRAMSDSYLADKAKVDDLAHLIAVQLLSACFTMPLDNSGMTAPNYKTVDNPEFGGPWDPRMISSLRMHTHFRYAPAFGYQARNPSPADQWTPSSYDSGHSMFRSRGSPDNKNMLTSNISLPLTRRRRIYRPESSLSSSSYENIDGADIDSFGSGDATDEYDVNKTTVNGRLAKRSSSQSSKAEATDNSPKADGVRASRSRFFNKRSLHSVIRSEPHPVYIQPVKELVATKWRSLRQRVGGSLQTLLPGDTSSIDHDPGSTASASVASDRPPSSDDRDRRRLARERSDIVSSSTEENPKYNSPASTLSPPDTPHYNTPERVGTPDIDGQKNPGLRLSPLATYKTIDPLDATYAQKQRRTSAPSTSSTTMMSDSGFFIPKRANSNTPSFVPRNPRRISHRKSTLSEVCTPDDFQEEESPYFSPGVESDNEVIDRSVLSAIGSALPSPVEELASLPGFSLEDAISEAAAEEERMRIRQSMRINSSGSQIFTPNADGLEVGGRPVGPGKEVWDAPGGKGKRKQLR